MSFYLSLEEFINQKIKAIFPLAEYSFLQIQAQKSRGEFSLSSALKLSSRLKKPPLGIAGQIKESILQDNYSQYGIEKIEVAPPGFVNIFLKKDIFSHTLSGIIKDKAAFFRRRQKDKVLVEFVSANPTGPLSIAHGRQAVVGDVIARIFSFCGWDVTKEYYINDEGKQIDLFVESVYQRKEELEKKPFQIPQGGYQGEYVKEIAQFLKAKGVDFEDRKALKQAALDYMLEKITQDLKLLGVEFSSWRRQSAFNQEGKIQAAIDILQKNGYIYEKEGALWFRSTALGDDKDRVVKRKDGTFTYFAADIAYHYDKIERGFCCLVNLWGPDHHGYIQRVKAAIKALGQKDILEVLIIQLVSVKNIKMSKRAGTAIFLAQLREEIGKDAARFFYLLRKNSSHLEVDIEQAKAKSLDNPLYYIQYAHARINSIVNNFQQKFIQKESEDLADLNKFLEAGVIKEGLFSCLDLLGNEEETGLLRHLLYFDNVLDISLRSREPYFIIDYLYNLALLFHKFYEKNRVLLADNLPLTKARLLLALGVKELIALSLEEILGVEAPDKMQ